ncbi:MAG TPA: hypothetical protein VK866_15855, partial [Acidimicrobiales bacterium]|nr:hypothetical protein [Acidimicrobiales bacterium]
MSRRRRRGALAALAAALALVTAAGHGPAPVGAAVDTPHQRTTPELALVERTPWVAAEGELRLALELRGIAPDATVRVTVHEPLRGRFELDASITRERLGRTLLTVVDSPVADAAPDGVLRLAVPVTEGTDGPPGSLRLLSEGISPVEVVVTDAEGDELVALVTHLVRLPTEVDAPLGVATALDLGAPPALQGDGSVVVPADVRARLTALADVLERHPDVVVTTMFTAETLSALAGGDAPLDAALVADLRTLTTAGVLAPVWSPWVRVDAARLDVSGLTSVVDEMLARGSATVRSTLGVAPDQATVLLPTEPTP